MWSSNYFVPALTHKGPSYGVNPPRKVPLGVPGLGMYQSAFGDPDPPREFGDTAATPTSGTLQNLLATVPPVLQMAGIALAGWWLIKKLR